MKRLIVLLVGSAAAIAGVYATAARPEAAGAEPAGSDAGDESPLPYALPGIGEKTVRKLVEGGFGSLDLLAAATAEQLSEIPGIGGKTAEKILAAAKGEGEAPGDETITTP